MSIQPHLRLTFAPLLFASLGVNYSFPACAPLRGALNLCDQGIPMIWGKLFPHWGRKQPKDGAALQVDKRRGPRVSAIMPIFIYGRLQGQPFSEHAQTANISPQGCLVMLSTEVERTHPLILTNLQTNEDLACRVARITRADHGKTLVGLDFLQPSPDFWSIEFRPAEPVKSNS